MVNRAQMCRTKDPLCDKLPLFLLPQSVKILLRYRLGSR
jgi:hypothetical protein